ncbi:MAG: hypothetical protein CBC25_06285 [Pelagibacteraceae bacterium TMED65]|nr:ABC transporter ATP-binding protein [Rickettsiales bacterium]OUU51029.1 MAG: hypothetical protein CBC25_06285 [Pelagibacteraceae bacterium TMED65]|tara:strand:+ start:1201 stop:1821 length:621 start_codon:yes stop_codon:yes gene_type:complete
MLFDIKNIKYKVEDFIILNNLSFKVNEEQHLLILGPSGSGKTTIINLLSGLLKPSSGYINFKNTKYSLLSELQLDQLRSENFGFIFQKLHLIGHLNVEQNIAIAKNKKNSLDINKLLDNLGLNGYNKMIVKNLSFGESQRVAVARGVVNNPKVIFADEPTSGLDDKNTELVIKLIFEQVKKTESTLIVSSHDQRIKKNFSKILEIK